MQDEDPRLKKYLLLFRESDDGFENFNKNVNHIAQVIMFAQSKDEKYVVGAYSDEALVQVNEEDKGRGSVSGQCRSFIFIFQENDLSVYRCVDK